MALSFKNVERAYLVFNEIRKTVLPQLSIGAFPEDMSQWEEIDRKNPPLYQVYGYDRKSDYGWENLVFFVKNPSEQLIEKFNELKNTVGNSSISEVYSRNKTIWCFGWF